MARERLKKLIYSKYLRILVMVCLVSTLGTVVLERSVQHAVLFSMLITATLTMSYLLTVRFAWDKTFVFYGVVLGGVPARLSLGLSLAYMTMLLTEVHVGTFVFSMMFWWVVFTAIEFGMALEYWHKVKWKNMKVDFR